MELKLKNLVEPTEKMRLMYEAVTELLKEGVDVKTVTISAITSRAGIGKGTAYEYFASKEEIIAHALMYEYSIKLQELATVTFSVEGFKERVYKVFDWLYENREYNMMFSHVMKMITPNESQEHCEPSEDSVIYGAYQYINSQIDMLMEDGFNEGVYSETDPSNRSFCLLSAMVEYAFLISAPGFVRFGKKTNKENQDYIYKSLIARLS